MAAIDAAAIRNEAESRGQGHVFAGFDALEAEAQYRLLSEVAAIDWDLLESLKGLITSPKEMGASSLSPAPTTVKGDDAARDEKARAHGESLLREGKVAAFVVAGGQGSRLGFSGPKGLYPATPIRRKSLFQLFAEKILATNTRYDTRVPWYVMTSQANAAETRSYFEAESYFGLSSQDVKFFSQDMLPALDEAGRIIMASKDSLFLSPNGHGGSLLALGKSGALADMAERGCEQIFYFQVDNPLVQIADPVFLGYHDEASAEMSTKVVPKRDAAEKVGVLGLIDGRYGVIEYSDLDPASLEARGDDGLLKFNAGNIAVHALRREFVESIAKGGVALPYHLAKKKIPAFDTTTQATETVNGFKFETFVFDALAECKESVVLSVDRNEEFAPIKNAEGEDSPATSQMAQSNLFAGWLEKRGHAVPRDDQGWVTVPVEISPLKALGPEDLDSADLDCLKSDGEFLLD